MTRISATIVRLPYRFPLLLTTCLLMISGHLNAQTASAAEADDAARRLWGKLFTQCGDTLVYSVSNIGGGIMADTLPRDPRIGIGGAPSHEVLPLAITQYRGVIIHAPLADASTNGGGDTVLSDLGTGRPNLPGIEWWGSITIQAIQWRTGVTDTRAIALGKVYSWSSYKKSGPPRRLGDAAFSIATDAFFSVGQAGSITLQMAKINGVWYYTRGFLKMLYPGTRYTLDQITTAALQCPSEQTIDRGDLNIEPRPRPRFNSTERIDNLRPMRAQSVQGQPVWLIFNAKGPDLARAELWRTRDVEGQSGNWSMVDSQPLSSNKTLQEVTLVDHQGTPGTRATYSVHVFDLAGKEYREMQPVKNCCP